MTKFVDVNAMRQLVCQTGVTGFIRQLVDCIEDDFHRWAAFDKVPRLASHSDIGVIELMPAADDKLYGFKYVNGHPGNAQHNKLTVMAFGVLAETDTGYPVLLSEFTLATALRTAATSVLAAKYLMRKDMQSMAVIGNGAQSEFQIIGFSQLLGIKEFWLYDIDSAATEKLISNLQSFSDITLHFCRSAEEAVAQADIITTITADKANATILTADQIRPGTYINAVGGDCPGKTELDGNILSKASVYVEYTPQSRIEGEIQQMPADFAVTELWEVITGQQAANQSASDIVVFDSVGFAVEDFSTLRLIRQLAELHNIGAPIGMIPAPENIRDLYSLLR